MALNQGLDPGGDDVIATASVRKNAKLVVQLWRTVHAHGDSNAVYRKKLDNCGCQQRCVGGETEIDGTPLLRGALGRIGHHVLEQREVHERFAAEECDVNGLAARGLLQKEID